jgi:hypothetical protein
MWWAHYNTARPHQGIAQRVPRSGHPAVAGLDREGIHRKPVLSDLINEYTRAALHPEDSQVTQADPIFERDRVVRAADTVQINVLLDACASGDFGGWRRWR